MGPVGIAIVVGLISCLLIFITKKAAYLIKHISRIPGPSSLPGIGNFHQFRLEPDVFYEQFQGLGYMFKDRDVRMAKVWLGPLPFIVIFGAEECEAVLGSSKMLNKLYHYRFLAPWIGDGLLISKPEKWRPRRKLLTPTFHYDILKDFVYVFNKHAKVLTSKFDKLADDDEFTDIFHTISLCTLDIICEAALGISANAQTVHTDYLDAVYKMKYIIHQRQIKPQFYSDFMFNTVGDGKEHDRCAKILHNFTHTAIENRQKMAEEHGGIKNLMKKERQAGSSYQLAFLDMMLEMHAEGKLSMEGVYEECDTFTFEGHDTTSSAINWFLHLMGANPEIQAKVHREIDDIVGEDLGDVSYECIGRLRYLEACFKETLRLYPSVPIFGRTVVEEIKIKGYTIPAGTGVGIVSAMVHKDPKYWPNPEIFDPERFMEKEIADIRHPFAYIPFSAGSRNCIGQRFAIIEEKCVLANIMRKFKVSAKLRTDEMRLSSELIIRPMFGNFIKFEKRSFGDYNLVHAPR
uniref:Cytochrome P450 n=1 Tax=Rhabditophanes sp. KR3021 TaxID=114890 RepID=A0AC35TK99_9BILA